MGKNKKIMKEYKNDYKITITYLGHAITVDLRKIIAINHPNDNDSYFCIHFDRAVWKVPADQHDRIYRAWMNIL